MKSTLPVAGAAFACLLLGLVSCTMAPQAIAPRATVDRFLAEASVLWTDEVTLQAVDGRWLIDDFVHGGDWQFTVKGSMKKMLLDVAELCSSP